MTKKIDDHFDLYDLKVEVLGRKKGMVCKHNVGDYFEVHGENLFLPNGQPFSIYALSALLPLIPAKQRKTDSNDWMTTDMDVACPDPNCGAVFRISRVNTRKFSHSDVSAIPLKK